MDRLITNLTLMFILIFVLTIQAISIIVKHHKYKRLGNLAKWSISGGYAPYVGIRSYTEAQYKFLLRTQDWLQIPDQYKLSRNDRQMMLSVISDFQRFLAITMALHSEEIINGNLFKKETDKDFFMAFLHDFLVYTQKWWENPDPNYIDRIREDKTNKLTKFGVCVFKIHYITCVYCRNSLLFNPSQFPDFADEKIVLSVLESGIYCKRLPPTF